MPEDTYNQGADREQAAAEFQAAMDSEGVDIGSDEIRSKAEQFGAFVVGRPTRHEDIEPGTVIDLWSGRPRN